MSNNLSVGMIEKVTNGKRFPMKVFRLSGKFNESTNRWMIRARLFTKDNKKLSSAYKKKLRTRPATMNVRKSFVILLIKLGSVGIKLSVS